MKQSSSPLITCSMSSKGTRTPQNSKLPLLICITLAFFSCYFVNRSGELSGVNRSVDSVVAILFFVSLLVHFAKNKIATPLAIGYLILFASTIPGLLLNDLFNIHWLYAIIFFEIIRTRYNPVGRGFNWLLYLTISSVLIQMSMYRFDGRPVLSIGDPNYSAYYLTIFAILLIYSNKILFGVAVIFLAYFTLSRALLLATIIFMSIHLINKIFKIQLTTNGWISLLLLIFFPIAYSTIFLFLNPEALSPSVTDYSRLLIYSDQSNINRSLANLFFIDHITENPMGIISGLNIESYTEEVFMNAPHTSAYQIIFNYGALYLIALFSLLYAFRKKIFATFHSLAFITMLLCWMLFLGGVLFGPQCIILALIINKCNSFNHGKLNKAILLRQTSIYLPKTLNRRNRLWHVHKTRLPSCLTIPVSCPNEPDHLLVV